MTTQVNVSRQTVLVAEREFDISDLPVDTAVPLIYLKPGTRILRGFVDITTAFNGDSGDQLSIGDTLGSVPDDEKYMDATYVDTTGIKDLANLPVADGVIDTTEAVTATRSVSGDATGATLGAGRLVIEYIEDTRSTEFHTYRG
jgi:hypothetical protein